MIDLDKICRFLWLNLNCDECPYQKRCVETESPLSCTEFLKNGIYRTVLIDVYSDFYTELDKILETRAQNEASEVQNGLLLARLELLDYIRKKTKNE